MFVKREYSLSVFWKLLIGVRDVELFYFKNNPDESDYLEELEGSSDPILGSIILKAGTSVILEEDEETGDVILCNGKYYIPWEKIEDAEAYDLISYDYAPNATVADNLVQDL